MRDTFVPIGYRDEPSAMRNRFVPPGYRDLHLATLLVHSYMPKVSNEEFSPEEERVYSEAVSETLYDDNLHAVLQKSEAGYRASCKAKMKWRRAQETVRTALYLGKLPAILFTDDGFEHEIPRNE